MSANIFDGFGDGDDVPDTAVIGGADAFDDPFGAAVDADPIDQNDVNEAQVDDDSVDDVAIVGNDDKGALDDPFGDAGEPEQDVAFAADDDIFAEANQAQGIEQQQRQDLFQEEPQDTPLSAWQAKRKEEIADRQAKERVEKERLREQAKMDIDTFYNQLEKSVEERQVTNRAEEEEFRADLESVMEYGTLWEKVGKLVDLKPKKGRGEEETARMRLLLLHLKNEKTTDVARV